MNKDKDKWQLCPKCNGQGIVSKPPYVAGDVNHWSSSSASFQCDVCEGQKIILAPVIEPREKMNKDKILSKEKILNGHIPTAVRDISDDDEIVVDYSTAIKAMEEYHEQFQPTEKEQDGLWDDVINTVDLEDGQSYGYASLRGKLKSKYTIKKKL